MIPVAGARRSSCVSRPSTLLFGDFQFDAADLEVTADDAPRVPARARGPRTDRGAGSRLLRATGHGTPVLAAVGAVVVNTTLAVILVDPLGLPGMAFAIAVAAWLEAIALIVLLRRREGTLGLASVASVAARTLVATALATLVGVVTRLLLEPALLPDPASPGPSGVVRLVTIIVVVSAVFGAVFVISALALRIGELRSIVAIMVEALRRPRAA